MYLIININIVILGVAKFLSCLSEKLNIGLEVNLYK
mgnify:CR=1 FL=1